MNYASPGKRFLSALIDWVILIIVASIINAILGAILKGEDGEGLFLYAIVSNLAAIVINWLYFAIQESSPKQGTIGKQALNIVVTDLNGEKVSFARATGRHFAKYISGLIIFIGYIMIFFTEKKQGLHDIIASTLVLDKQASVQDK